MNMHISDIFLRSLTIVWQRLNVYTAKYALFDQMLFFDE